MKNMKKILALLMTGAMVVGFASCGKSDDKKATENNDKNLVVGFDQNFPPVPSTVSGTDSPLTDVKMITPGQILT